MKIVLCRLILSCLVLSYLVSSRLALSCLSNDSIHEPVLPATALFPVDQSNEARNEGGDGRVGRQGRSISRLYLVHARHRNRIARNLILVEGSEKQGGRAQGPDRLQELT